MIAKSLGLLAAGGTAALGLWAAPLAANAQAPSYSVRGETISGTVASVENVNHLFVADDRGYTDDVTLRTGAAILSNGVRLEPGQRVTITGSAAGKTFLATRIATNGRSYSAEVASAPAAYPVPVPVYYPAYYAQPVYYGYYGYGGPYFYGYASFYGGYGRYYGYGYGGYRGYGYGGYRGYGYGGYRGYGYGGYHGGGFHGSISIGVRGRSR